MPSATFLKEEVRELLNGVYEEESTKDEDLCQIQSGLGKEAVSLLMSVKKETKLSNEITPLLAIEF